MYIPARFIGKPYRVYLCRDSNNYKLLDEVLR